MKTALRPVYAQSRLYAIDSLGRLVGFEPTRLRSISNLRDQCSAHSPIISTKKAGSCPQAAQRNPQFRDATKGDTHDHKISHLFVVGFERTLFYTTDSYLSLISPTSSFRTIFPKVPNGAQGENDEESEGSPVSCRSTGRTAYAEHHPRNASESSRNPSTPSRRGRGSYRWHPDRGRRRDRTSGIRNALPTLLLTFRCGRSVTKGAPADAH